MLSPVRQGSYKRSRDAGDGSPAHNKRAIPCDKRSSPQAPSSPLRNLTPLATPTKQPVSPRCYSRHRHLRHLSPSRAPLLEHNFSDLTLWSPPRLSPPALEPSTHAIFRTPEIVDRILRFLDAANSVPREKPRTRRKPQSLAHALLICDGDEAKAQQLWSETCPLSREPAQFGSPVGLSQCLLVNRLWHALALAIITENLHFAHHDNFKKLAALCASRTPTSSFSKPASLVLHKLTKLTQQQLDAVVPLVASPNLKWLELYICPKVQPPLSLFQRSCNLEKLVLPGNRCVTDALLMNIAPHLGKLRVLDLRACDQVTDGGVLSITTNCPQLEVCNLGRHRNGDAITSVSLVALARNTRVDTVGAAGCHVTDAGIWELAMHRGAHIKRLSLNNCRLLTNNSVPALLALNYFPNLAVLEIRDVKHITNLQPIVAYTRAKRSIGCPVLIEGGERIDHLIRQEEWRLDKENSARVLAALTEWVNEEDPDDRLHSP